MAGRLPPFTLDDFKLSPAKRAEITDGLTERQTFMVNQWMNLHDKLNVGDWSGFGIRRHAHFSTRSHRVSTAR